MYLTVEETAAVLGVSTNWVRERMDAGDCKISRHLKCRRDTAPPRRTDRSPVRIASADLARYILSNTRAHGWDPFDNPATDPSALEALELQIWRYLSWYRRKPSPTSGETPRDWAVSKKPARRVS